VQRLQAGIERGDLTLEYQPKADMRTGAIVGVEALARWDDADRGRIPPSDFIPTVERSREAIKALTEWSLDAAAAQASAWQHDGMLLTVAVNLSPRSLLDPELADTVARTLAKWELNANHIDLELTETALFGVTDPDRVAKTLDELAQMDLLLALDDFGTGYSSLARLRDMPIDNVKIDKSFVSQMNERPSDALIVRGVIALAKSLRLRVVAEGVESEAVWRRLRGLGCDVAQGNYLSPPLPPDELTAWVRQWEELYEEAHRMAEELLERRMGPDDRRSGADDRRHDGVGRRRFARAGDDERAA
jgi:EAL domain-containing protein (putative c-di-GMP-specific phosphodiesterase class I)